MLRHAIFLILFLVFAVWLGIQLQQDPGFALFSWQNISVEMPLWFAALCLLLAFYLCWQLSRLVGALPHSLYRLTHWREARQWRRSAEATRNGLLELLAHRWQKAERHLTRHTAMPELQPIQWLGAAFAAHRQGAIDRREMWLPKVEDLPARLLLKADFALDDHHPEQVLTLLATRKLTPAILIRLQKALRRLERWEELLNLVPALRKAGTLADEKADRLERKTARAWLASENSPKALQAIWQRLPRRLQQDARIVRAYLLPLTHHPETLPITGPLLTSTLNRQFDATLTRLYGEMALPDPKKQLHQAEKWLKSRPNQPALLLALGQLAIRCRLWGKARTYLTDCLDHSKKEPKARALLGWLEEQAGDPEAALVQYREGLREMTPF